MILCHDNRIGIFLIPKTGTVSLYQLLCKEYKLSDSKHSHYSFDMLDDNLKEQISNYRFFSFYRDPVDRFISAILYYKRKCYADLLHIMYGNKISISCLCRTPYHLLDTATQQAIENITITDIIENKNVIERIQNPIFQPQTKWLDHPITITLLNYHNYDSEVKKLMSYFNYCCFDIPKLNESIRIPAYDQIDHSTFKKIKNLYQQDYEFFASKGITFSS